MFRNLNWATRQEFGGGAIPACSHGLKLTLARGVALHPLASLGDVRGELVAEHEAEGVVVGQQAPQAEEGHEVDGQLHAQQQLVQLGHEQRTHLGARVL